MLTVRGTAQDYQGDAGDDWRETTAYRPPAPRPADPDQEILRPGNVAVASSVPLQLGGDLGFAITSGEWSTPDGAVLTRVSGHQIGVPLALSFMATMPPKGEPAFRPGRRGSPVGRDDQSGHRQRRQHQHDGCRAAPGACCGRSRCRCEILTSRIRRGCSVTFGRRRCGAWR